MSGLIRVLHYSLSCCVTFFQSKLVPMISLYIYDRLGVTNNKTVSRLAYRHRMFVLQRWTSCFNVKWMTTRLLILLQVEAIALQSGCYSFQISWYVRYCYGNTSMDGTVDWRYLYVYHLVYHIYPSHRRYYWLPKCDAVSWTNNLKTWIGAVINKAKKGIKAAKLNKLFR